MVLETIDFNFDVFLNHLFFRWHLLASERTGEYETGL